MVTVGRSEPLPWIFTEISVSARGCFIEAVNAASVRKLLIFPGSA